MSRRIATALAILLAGLSLTAQSTRIASDFEIRKMEELAAKEKSFTAQLAARLNLGDVRTTRNESALARREYETALAVAEKERMSARQKSDLGRYVTATAYAALAAAKLDDAGRAFALTEEATRFGGAESTTWNVVAGAFSVLQMPRKAASAAENSVRLAAREAEANPTTNNLLDLAISRFTLGSALENAGESAAAIPLLETVITSLRARELDPIRRSVARNESFEIFRTARSEEAAYLATLNQAQLLLATIFEQTGEVAKARALYQSVLADRTDDAFALAGMARLSGSESDRFARLAESLDANPFAIEVIREYRRLLAGGGVPDAATLEGGGAGARVRKALAEMAEGQNRAARGTIDSLIASFPDNDVLRYLAALNDIAMGDEASARRRTIRVAELRSEIVALLIAEKAPAPKWLDANELKASPTADELRAIRELLKTDRLTPEQKGTLDRIALRNAVTFASAEAAAPGQTLFEKGTLEGIAFTFPQPTLFRGTFLPDHKLMLEYRILGVTEPERGAPVLLVEPLRLEAAR